MKEQIRNNLNLFEDEISAIFERYEDYVEKNKGQICTLVEEQFPNWDRKYGINIFLFEGSVMAQLTVDGENKTVYYTKEGWSQRFVRLQFQRVGLPSSPTLKIRISTQKIKSMKNLIFMWIVAITMLIETGILVYCVYHISTIILFSLALLAIGIVVSTTIDYFKK